VRQRAAELTARRPGDQPPALEPLLRDPEAAVVETTAWACGERLPPEPGIVAALVAVAGHHDDALCREAAVAALGAIGDPAGLPAILDATHDRPAVRRRAVLALAPFEGDEVDAALARARDDRDWQVRQAAEDLTGE
jgi:HEAT repeat protein